MKKTYNFCIINFIFLLTLGFVLVSFYLILNNFYLISSTNPKQNEQINKRTTLFQFKQRINNKINKIPFVKICSHNNNRNNSNIKTKAIRIGFFLMGTGLYVRLIEQLISSLDKHFCPNSNHYYVHYFILTDALKLNTTTLNKNNYTLIYTPHLKWPLSTLLRFQSLHSLFYSPHYIMTSFDYLYWLDVDMQLVENVCEDILGDLVGVIHPQINTSKRKYPYESSNKQSMAYLSQSNRYENPYYFGAFWGGKSEQVFKLVMTCDEYVKYDYEKLNGFIAHQHDESHLNRCVSLLFYFSDHITKTPLFLSLFACLT